MPVHDKAEVLLDKIGEALENLVRLEIQTAVTSLEVKPEGNEWTLIPTVNAGVEGVTTVIDLLQGDIKNAVSSGALQNQQVMTLHADQVKLSRDIVAGNLKALMDLAQSLTR